MSARQIQAYARDVTSWTPGDGGWTRETLSQGGEKPATRPGLLLAAAAALLVLGVVVGARIDDHLRWPGSEHVGLALTGGAVAAATRIDDRHRFQVALFNSGEEPVRVRVVGIVGLAVPVADSYPVTLAAHRWGQLLFSLPSECDEAALPRVTALRVSSADGSVAQRVTQRVALAAPATALGVVHTRECAPATRLGRRDLGGLWYLEEVEGRWVDLAHLGLMRFTADGRFAFDPEGLLFQEGEQGMLGTYRLHGTRLVIEAHAGYACERGFSETWTTTLLAKDLLRLDIVRSDLGYCNSPPGERQILRRLVAEDGLPARGPVSDRRR